MGLNLRGELRRALLAAGETCWAYAALATVGAMAHTPRLLSPISIWFIYWAALEIGQYLPRLRLAWRRVQILNVALAVFLMLIVLRLDLYRTQPALDLSWLGALAHALFIVDGKLAPEHLAIVALLYAYVRGAGFGSRPLTLWFVGFQFRLGVLLFFCIALAGAILLAHPVDLAGPLVAFFILSLLGIALARIDESGRERGLGARWAALLLGAVVVIVLVGLFVTPLFTVAGENLILQLVSPLLPVLLLLLTVILTPLAWLAGILVQVIGPLLAQLLQGLRHFGLTIDTPTPPNPAGIPPALAQWTFIFPYLRLAGGIAFVFAAALLVARALNRRMMQIEQETFYREAAGALAAAPTARPKRPPAVRPDGSEIEAENIRRVYAALLARAAALGLPRAQAETPLEFLPRLAARFPESAADLERITQAYVAVHYAEQPATRAQVHEIRAVWQHVRSEMGMADSHHDRKLTGTGKRDASAPTRS
ncbi:MAG: DUF4129 domain-containing protein [Anaerolineae bacterium]